MAAIGIIVLACGLFWGLYPPPSPHVTLHQTSQAKVVTYASKHAPCSEGASGGLVRTDPNDGPLTNATQFTYKCSPPAFGDKAFFTILVVIVTFALLIKDYPAELVVMAAAIILYAAEVLTVDQAFGGLASTAVLSIASMFVVAKCLEETGTVDYVARIFLGAPKSLFSAILRLNMSVGIPSAFVLTTPLVAMMIPVVLAWAQRINISPSKLMMPLSFAAMIGGMCTTIGAAVNLVIASLLTEHDPTQKFKMFDFFPVGAPLAAVMVVYMCVMAKFLLPGTSSTQRSGQDGDEEAALRKSRNFFSYFKVLPKNAMVGHTVGKSGIEFAQDLSLLAIIRDGEYILSDPSELIKSGDVLVMTGLPEGIAQFRRDLSLDLLLYGKRITQKRYRRRLIEVVISTGSPLVGVELSSPLLRDHYSATVVAVRPACLYNGLKASALAPLSGTGQDTQHITPASGFNMGGSFLDLNANTQDGADLDATHDVGLSLPVMDTVAVSVDVGEDEVYASPVCADGSLDAGTGNAAAAVAVLTSQDGGRTPSPLPQSISLGAGTGVSLDRHRAGSHEDQALIAVPRFPSMIVPASSFVTMSNEQLLNVVKDTCVPTYRLQSGDSVVLEAHQLLTSVHMHSNHFALMRTVQDSKPPITDSALDQFRRVFGGVILIAIIVLSAIDAVPLLAAASVGAMIMMAMKCITVEEAFHNLHGRVLLVVVGAFAIGHAMELTGVAQWIARAIVALTLPGGDYWVLFGVGLVTGILATIIGDKSAVIIMFHISVSAHEQVASVSLKQFCVQLLMSSSTCFASPLGYVTSIMVQRPGGYSFLDYTKFGLGPEIGLLFLATALVMALIP